MQMTAQQLAAAIGGTVIGDPSISASKISGIEKAHAGNISFLGNLKYKKYLSDCQASIILVPADTKEDPQPGQAYILLEDVMSGMQQLSVRLNQRTSNTIISKHSTVGETAFLSNDISLGHYSIVEDGAKIGSRTQIHGQVYVGENVQIGEDCILYPGVKIYHDCVIGDRVIIHSNAVIGSDGFGYAFSNGQYNKIHQLGNVIIEQDVEIGSNTVIDRAAFNSTIIKKGVKLDNLIQIAHNVEIGSHTVMAAQSGVAGSAKVGTHCQIGGQVAIVGHIEVADKSQIQGKSGVASDIKDMNKKWYGYPAMPFYQYLKSYAVFKKLPDLARELRELHKLIDKIKH